MGSQWAHRVLFLPSTLQPGVTACRIKSFTDWAPPQPPLPPVTLPPATHSAGVTFTFSFLSEFYSGKLNASKDSSNATYLSQQGSRWHGLGSADFPSSLYTWFQSKCWGSGPWYLVSKEDADMKNVHCFIFTKTRKHTNSFQNFHNEVIGIHRALRTRPRP